MSLPRTEPGRLLRKALEEIGVRDPERGMMLTLRLRPTPWASFMVREQPTRNPTPERLTFAAIVQPTRNEGWTWSGWHSPSTPICTAHRETGRAWVTAPPRSRIEYARLTTEEGAS